MNNILVITPTKHIKNFEKTICKFGKVKFLDDPLKTQLLKIIENYNIIFTNPNKSKIFFNKEIIDKGKNLKIICTASTGTNHIDLNYAIKKKIKVISITKEFKTLNKISSTAELALTLTLACARNLMPSYLSVLDGNWDYTPFIGRQLDNLNIGIIGYGRLGKIYARLTKNFRGNLYVYDPFVKVKSKKIIQISSLQKFISNCDIISIHIHATNENENFINKKIFKFMKNDVILINTSRGEVINERDLIDFLKNNKKAKYGTDVISQEIVGRKKNKIIKFAKKSKQILITPHIGGMTSEAQQLAYMCALKLLKSYLEKEN